ncbi:hypothetical protein DM02DRAFT_677809 [Periconia macrospinosa]|uniref:BRCT domain-containing protein n=1 Tax=Periconia macrospinosa TaxID=97972 RepID=A0A2V1D3X9_9PLEO|nr:hypothetical protein DM02DRAFT_677809 [Periconia macrospinosa]
MAWYFVHKDAEGRQTRQYEQGRADQKVFFVRTPVDWSQTSTEPADKTKIVCVMTFKSWGVVLEARNDPLEIVPHHSLSEGEPPSDAYTLQPSSKKHSEVILLREKDHIRWSRVPDSWIVLTRGTSTQVQVTSSVSAEEQARQSEEIQNDANDPEDMTEDDDEDLDQSLKIGQSMSRSTPLPSAARTEVVQETPTAPRSLFGPYNETFSTAPTKLEEENVIEVAVPEAKGTPASQTTNSSAKSRKRAKIEIPAKQPTPATPADDDDDTNQSQSPPSKRKRTEELPNTPLTRTKKPRTSDPGPDKPRVAFSNSTIQSPSQFTRYLKKNGGTIADAVDETCTVLCVKDGPLSKTPKLLHSIALGIPIVTDTWLVESTKRGGGTFLPLAPYKPSCAAQEAEWGFTLSSIWSTPLTSLFKNHTILFTPALKATYTNFTEIENVCKAAGAKKVVSRIPTAKDNRDVEGTIILAASEHDAKEAKRKFNKEFLPRAILRGVVDVESEEFRIAGVGDGGEDGGEGEEEEVTTVVAVSVKGKKKGRGKKAA